MLASLLRARSALVLGLLLAASLVGAGVLQMVFVFRAEAAFQDLVRSDVPELRRVQEITRATSEIHRHMLGALLDDAPDENRTSLERCRLAMEEAAALFQAAPIHGKFKEQEKQVRGNWETYQAKVGLLLAALEGGRKAEALRMRREVVRPVYEEMRAGLAAWSKDMEVRARDSADASRSALRFRHMLLLVFCAWPLAVALIALAALMGFWLYAAVRLPDDSDIMPR